ncbi:hypothetical protein J7E93_17320 [Streptomyces sp. ISL-36]|uniref:hypothetical protein n=1 Tax=Streptomyces sp. ISL-36 TaxID=2819182 RepID=UPI001BE7F372|nr:hypothetical protein [Streptomyces sp. ISL-36]MBT2441839.1 hypothetical protein [Streptomyces sp. ISL-36]
MSAGTARTLRVVVDGDMDDDSPVSVLRRAAALISERPEQRVVDVTFEYDVMNLRWKGSLYFTEG